MSKSILSGKLGAWIWQYQNCEKGDWLKIAQKAQQYNIGYLLVKMADNVRYSYWTKAKLQEVKKILKDHNVILGGWNYSLPSTYKQEIDVINSFYQDGIDFWNIDAEAEFQIPNSDQIAEDYLSKLRAKIGKDVLLCHAPLGILQYHPFPYYQFSKYCDYSMPQHYHTEFGWSLDKTISMGDKGWNDFFIKHTDIDQQSYAPITVSYGRGYPHVPGELKKEDIIKFFDHYKNCDTLSFYSWDASFPLFWNTLKEINDTQGSVFAPKDDPINDPLPIPDEPADPIIVNPTPLPPEPITPTPIPTPPSNSNFNILNFLKQLFQWFKLK